MRERSTDWLPPTRAWTGDYMRAQTGDRNCNLDVCSEREPNPQSSGHRMLLQLTHKGQGQTYFLDLFLTILHFTRGLRAAMKVSGRWPPPL